MLIFVNRDSSRNYGWTFIRNGSGKPSAIRNVYLSVFVASGKGVRDEDYQPEQHADPCESLRYHTELMDVLHDEVKTSPTYNNVKLIEKYPILPISVKAVRNPMWQFDSGNRSVRNVFRIKDE